MRVSLMGFDKVTFFPYSLSLFTSVDFLSHKSFPTRPTAHFTHFVFKERTTLGRMGYELYFYLTRLLPLWNHNCHLEECR